MGSGSTRIPLRQQVEELSEQSIGVCYQCGNCSSGCPMGPWMDALPNHLIRRLQLGLEDTTRFESPWVCASCFACGVRCPKGIDVPRVMEARGLDVTPGMMERFAAIGDQETVGILELILREEIGHVEAGSRWFRALCATRGLDPEETYFTLLEQHLGSNIRCPLHIAARRQAGFTDSELGRLEALCKRS